MTAGELIERLSKFPEDAVVCTRPDSEDFSDAVAYMVNRASIGAAWYHWRNNGSFVGEPPDPPSPTVFSGTENLSYENEMEQWNRIPKEVSIIVMIS